MEVGQTSRISNGFFRGNAGMLQLRNEMTRVFQCLWRIRSLGRPTASGLFAGKTSRACPQPGAEGWHYSRLPGLLTALS
jgi:hypothetical protein